MWGCNTARGGCVQRMNNTPMDAFGLLALQFQSFTPRIGGAASEMISKQLQQHMVAAVAVIERIPRQAKTGSALCFNCNSSVLSS